MDIITRKEAQEQGLPRFYTGIACDNGHVSERYTASNGCVACKPLTSEQKQDARKKYVAELEAKTGRRVLTRKEAKKLGLLTHFTGIPCSKGHLSERYTVAGCVQCINESTKKRMARIYSNPEEHADFNFKAKMKRRRYWNRHKERLNQEKREKWVNDEDFRNKMKAINADYIKRTNYSNSETRKQWAENNKDKVAEYAKRSREKHVGTNKYLGYLYRRRKRAAMPPWADKEAIKKMYEKVARMNRLAKKNTPGLCAFHVDHVVPLNGDNVSGLHIPANLRIIRASDNLRKGNKMQTSHGEVT
jgi:predicted RNA-binding protein YlxR (DUF448 family)